MLHQEVGWDGKTWALAETDKNKVFLFHKMHAVTTAVHLAPIPRFHSEGSGVLAEWVELLFQSLTKWYMARYSLSNDWSVIISNIFIFKVMWIETKTFHHCDTPPHFMNYRCHSAPQKLDALYSFLMWCPGDVVSPKASAWAGATYS